jgi:hypothetical protein
VHRRATRVPERKTRVLERRTRGAQPGRIGDRLAGRRLRRMTDRAYSDPAPDPAAAAAAMLAEIAAAHR